MNAAGGSARASAARQIGTHVQRLARAVLWASLVPFLASCTVPREITKTARSAIEQLLLSEAMCAEGMVTRRGLLPLL
jgi:phosphate/sulfate permease